ncbi:MAG: hypothetical protein QM640_02965 [Niabella sp.]
MKYFKIILLFFFSVLYVALQAQSSSKKIDELFMQYLNQQLALTPSETGQVKPLLKSYLNERKKISKDYTDPLDREEQVVALKIKYRKKLSPILGMQKANQFFSHEQTFRRKIKEELKERKKTGD